MQGYDIKYIPENMSLKDKVLGRYDLIRVLSTWWVINNFEKVIPKWVKDITIIPNGKRAEFVWSKATYFQDGKVETRYKLFELFNKKDQSK